MPIVDFLIYLLGIYGLAWLLVFSNIFYKVRQFIFGFEINFFSELIECIVCTSVWISMFFVFFYFPAECWYTKLLIVGTTTTTTWGLANLFGDID